MLDPLGSESIRSAEDVFDQTLILMPVVNAMEVPAARLSARPAVHPQRGRIVCSAGAAPAAPAKLKPDWAGVPLRRVVARSLVWQTD